ncbi:hypothetical protein [Poseidonocella sp. HB161398]|uniref:hypothetical protein n=1 Tax=Poseidonocella sp. HB161398 TaxID=2320855 RepID=UPI0011092A11|nr:hypothetical protein [Poseidonocella sp. HB161398]
MKTTLTSLCLALLATGALAEEGQPRNCADRDDVLQRLSKSYGETRQSIGIGANNSLVEVFASDETGTWTITVTMPDGMTCLIASGQAYEKLIHDKLLQPGDDA